MKKLFYLFLLLPFTMLISCSDDKDFSPVDMTLTLSGVTQYDETFYTVAGEEVSVENLTVKSIDGKNTGVANVVISLNGFPLSNYPGDPYAGSFSTENLPAGKYLINVTGNLLQVDSSIKIFTVDYPLVIVEDSEALPAGAGEIGEYSQTIRLNQ